MLSFDTVSKKHAHENPRDFARLRLIELSESAKVEVITPEQPTVIAHQADILIKVTFETGREILVHFEFQTADSYEPPMALRMAWYIIWLIKTYRMPVYSNVIYLRPNAGRNDPGRFVQDEPGNSVFVEYQVFRLIDMDGEHVLNAKIEGLIPFAPLMKRPAEVSTEEWLRRCVRVADSLDVPNKPAYLGGMAVLGNLTYDRHLLWKVLTEETMHESDLVQYWSAIEKQKGIQQGERTRAQADILEVLELRLQSAGIFQPRLEAIDDLQRLEQLLRAAILADSPEDFRKVLDQGSHGV